MAQMKLGNIYVTGAKDIGFQQDYTQAAKWFRLAAEQGNVDAQYNLGTMYSNGQGVPQDYAQAVKWLRLAAEQGDASAQNSLGLMYGKGEGVPEDYVQAHKWFNLAAAQGNANGATNRDITAKLMTPQQIERAQALARNWKPKK